MKAPPIFTLLLFLYVLLPGCATEDANDHIESPVEPEQSLQTFELADPNLRIELFASEPLVMDPVAMEIDENGDVYVVEMPGYPLDTEGSGRVKLLKDTNGDGTPNEATVFADGLIFPKGIMRWKNGILVTDAPDLVYLEDSTGDGKADIRDVMLTGFARSNPQHNFNKPLYGLDNWIYLANRGAIHTEMFADQLGDEGSKVMFAGHPDGPVLPVNADGRNVRFKPDSLELEMLSTSSQFGHDFDTWGRHFLIHNRIHVYHEAISARYTDRNPDLVIRSAEHNSPLHSPEVFPITDNPMHQLLTDVGIFTSASSITLQLGELFGEDYENASIVAESQHNLVHTDIITENGSVFDAERQFEGVEFLASTDSWFRPVNFYTGPDGALYLIDYYRQIIEHPEWMDEETLQSYDVYAGMDHGRIFRISTEENNRTGWINRIELGNDSTDELVQSLDHANIWWRRNAQRLLVDRQDPDAVAPLKRLFETSQNPKGRLHALWSLDGLGAIEPALIRTALDDEVAGVRENAVRLAEQYAAVDPSLVDDLLSLENDPSDRVRYQLLLTLGDFDDPHVHEVRDRILFDHIEDHWFQIAAFSAPSANGWNLFEQALAQLTDRRTAGREHFFRTIGSLIATGSAETDIQEFLERTAGGINPDDEWWQSAAMTGFSDQIRRSGIGPELIAANNDILLESFFQAGQTDFRSAVIQLLQMMDGAEVHESLWIERAESLAANPGSDEDARADAIQLLGMTGLAGQDRFKQKLFEFVSPAEPASVQEAALQILTRVEGEDVGEFVISRWDVMTPRVRDQAVNVMMTEPARIRLLLDAVEDGRVMVSTIGWGRRVALMRDRGADEEARYLRDRARELLSRDPDARRETVTQYITALDDYSGDQNRGREIFRNNCSACHQISGEYGVDFGPDAATFRHWSPRALITKILDPNRSVSEDFNMWAIERINGETVSGIIVEESGQSVTIRQASGAEIIIARPEIESISSSNISPMPEGLEQQIDKSDMVDLIDYIRSGGD